MPPTFAAASTITAGHSALVAGMKKPSRVAPGRFFDWLGTLSLST